MKRRKAQAVKALAKKNRMENPGHKSRYARKMEFLRKNGGRGIDYPDKPWR